MALDAQSNWNVEMAQPLRNRAPVPVDQSSDSSSQDTQAILLRKENAQEVILPVEVVVQIVSYIPRGHLQQGTLWACCLVSRIWYSATVPRLYERPHLTGGNFQNFVATVCPSKNAHIRRSELAEFVRTLDMGELVHDGSKSLTARLLGRLKGNLIDFVAPQSSFSINSFAALSKCTNLRYLNLSLMSASVSNKRLFQSLQGLTELETLFFPRTASQDQEIETTPYSWPPKLKALHLAGGVNSFFLRVHVRNVPPSLETLSIQQCPQVYSSTLQELLEDIGSQLRNLTIRHPMDLLFVGVLDRILFWCPNLLALRISVDFISDRFLERENIGPDCKLRILDLDCSDSASADVGVSPDAIWVAVDNGYLPDLRSVRVSLRLAWQTTRTLRSSVADLVELLEDQQARVPLGVTPGPGVWSFNS